MNCTAGVVYTILNNMPWFKYARNEFGSIVIAEYFMGGGRGQWGCEGYIMSVLTTILSLFWLYLNNIEKFVDDHNQFRVNVMTTIVIIFFLQ